MRAAAHREETEVSVRLRASPATAGARTGRLLAAIIACAGCGAVQAAAGENYPSRPIRMVVPFPAGGATDVLARIVSPKLAARLGQNVIVDNRSGASGNVGSELAARAAPDGYTLIMGNVSSHAINAAVFKLPYDPVKDFAPVTVVAVVTNVLVVHPTFQAKSVKDLIAAARAAPGKIDYASAGNGSPAHLAAELFKLMAKVDLTHVPFNGNAPATTSLLGGQVALMFNAMPAAMPHVRSGKLRALAVTSAARSRAAPELPTIAESGLPGYEVTAWNGVLAPAGTPAAIVERIYRETAAVLRDPEVAERYEQLGAEALGNTPREFATLLARDVRKWGEVARAARLRLD